jgi:hypothetical protein
VSTRKRDDIGTPLIRDFTDGQVVVTNDCASNLKPLMIK